MKINRLFYTIFIEPLLSAPKKTLKDIIVKKRYTDILEVGCGTGKQSIMISQSGINVTCVDISDSMFPKNYSSKGKLTFLKADGRSIPLNSKSFDAALISLALHEMDKEYRIPVLKEMLRLLRDRGSLYIMDYSINPQTRKSFAKFTIKFIEWLAGKRHNRNFKNFIQNGGVPPLAAQLNLKIKVKIPIFGGSGAIFGLTK